MKETILIAFIGGIVIGIIITVLVLSDNKKQTRKVYIGPAITKIG